MIEPKFSVIIPTFRRNDLLARCLERLAPGVQELSSADYEVIVTDDDGTAMDALATQFPWVRWNKGPGKGPASNRNSGAAVGLGKWLVFTDDDCVPSPAWLSAYAAAIADDVDVYEGKTTCESGMQSPIQHAPVNLTGGCLWSCNFMLSRRLFEQVGGFDGGFPHPHMEDTEFKERVGVHSRIRFVVDACVDHPPRRQAFGSRLAAHQESRVYYDALKAMEPSLLRLLVEILRCRAQALRRHKLSMDSLIAIISLIAEVAFVAAKFGAWKRQYYSGSRAR